MKASGRVTASAWALVLALAGAGMMPGNGFIGGFVGAAWADGVAPVPSQAVAEALPADLARLAEVMKLPDTLAVMRLEGLDYGDLLEEEMFPGEGGPGWAARVAQIYDPQAMLEMTRAGLSRELAGKPEVIAAATAFFGSDLGQKIIALEIEARHVLLDDKAEEAAKARVETLRAEDDPRLATIEKFAAANDLVEMNVTGALNANLAFYRGLNAGGAFPGGMTETDMLAEVQGQEDAIRQETEDWLFPYLTLAYEGLSDEELADYLAFSATEAGKALNLAVFAAFEDVFATVSTALGRAVADQLSGSDI